MKAEHVTEAFAAARLIGYKMEGAVDEACDNPLAGFLAGMKFCTFMLNEIQAPEAVEYLLMNIQSMFREDLECLREHLRKGAH